MKTINLTKENMKLLAAGALAIKNDKNFTSEQLKSFVDGALFAYHIMSEGNKEITFETLNNLEKEKEGEQNG